MRRAGRTLTLVVGAGLALLPAAIGAEASTGASVTPQSEAWYQPNPSCAGPAGCLTTDTVPASLPTQPPTNPFPAGTMHIGASGGQETARSYLALDLSVVTGSLSTGRLTVPLDVATEDGSMSPETAKIQVCLATETVHHVEGAIDAPPATDCAATAVAKYVAAPQPHLDADLAPLLAGLPDALGIALLPDAKSLAPTDAWRVVFSAHDRADAAKTPPATIAVTSVDPPAVPGQVPAARAAVPALGAVDAPAAPTTAVLSAPVPAPAEAPAVAAPQAVAAAPAAVRTRTVGYPYPSVWLLPLVLLVVVPLTIRCLTQDLTPRSS